MALVQQLTLPTEGISCHAWNGDRTMIAFCPNNNEIHIYGQCQSDNWTRLHILTEHDLLVSGLDWSAENNKIVSCSHDRNAFVWTYFPATSDEPEQWKPALVILRIDRAALDVKWSNDGLRFAVTSGAKSVPVCTYEPANDWWVSKIVKKKFKSTVLCCAFHPTNGQLLATGSADFKCRVYSTFTADVDGTVVNAGAFGTPQEFGETYVELSAFGWVNAVAWSPSGEILAFAGQDSSVHLATFTPAGPVVRTIRFKELPLNKLLFLSETGLVGGGHDFNPIVFAPLTAARDGEWGLYSKLDQRKEEAAAPAGGGSNSGVAAARALFQNKAARGQEKKTEGDTLWTQHENAITGLSNAGIGGPNQVVRKVATSGLDGRLVLWDLPELDILDLAKLSLA